MASPYLARASSLARGAFTVASGGFAGSVSAVTGLGGAVVFIPALSKLGYEARHIVGTAVVAVTGATAAGSFASRKRGERRPGGGDGGVRGRGVHADRTVDGETVEREDAS